jgi:A/G-specific adenine glycosylase
VGQAKLPAFSSRLMNWWDRHGRKDLPWQHPRTPYRVWVSEIMLQQTQVSTVIPYFERWIARFPDIESLAPASLDEVLSLWSGLGYYARARNLHKAAVLCAEQHGGALPGSAADLAALPGIGQSTANAIVSQSTDRPAAVLDGNVRRVLARHAVVEGWTGKTAVQRRLWQEAEDRLPAERGADYTQAVMDLGSLLCTRSNPDCEHCPVNADCQARLQGRVHELPSPKPATKVSNKKLSMVILRDDRERILLHKRPPAGIWGGLWCLPEGASLAEIERQLGVECAAVSQLPAIEHRLSHVRMSIQPVLADVKDSGQVKCTTNLEWFGAAEQDELGLPRPVSDLLNRLNNGEFK